MIKYKEHEIDISTTNYSDGVVIIPLPNNEIVCIPEENCTSKEYEIIQCIKEDVKKRPVIEPVDIKPQPTQEDRISQLETLVLQLGGVL